MQSLLRPPVQSRGRAGAGARGGQQVDEIVVEGEDQRGRGGVEDRLGPEEPVVDDHVPFHARDAGPPHLLGKLVDPG
ncbi:hypothetical protein ACFXA0_13310 [Streptomyces cyaneofuscatus]|uniref:hypothetical protein n=1 Tax=Streptomyces cyaneofuscatus TaxID=66883 RepID=UPI00368B4783